MKITFLATGDSPDYYTFSGETVTAHKDGIAESFDLSALEAGGEFTGVSIDALPLEPAHVIRHAYRDAELHVTLCQQVGPGHWRESAEIDSAEYDPDAIHAVFTADGVGTPWARTRQGKITPEVG